MKRRDGEAGLTLVEVLVGLVILGLMAGLVLETTRLGAAAWTRAERTSAATDDLDSVHGFLRGLIGQAYPAFASADPGDRRLLFEGGPHGMLLVAPLPGLLPEGAWAVAHLALADGPPAPASASVSTQAPGAGKALTLTWRLDLPGADGRPSPLRAERLLPRVTALRLAYFGPPEPGAPPAWLDHWVGRERLPALVRVVVERDGVAWPEIVVAPRVTASAACVYDAAAPVCLRIP